MNLRKVLGFMFALILISWGAAGAYTDVSLSFGFHDVLAPYGSWVQVSSYGEVWRPQVSAGFVPYTNGHWVYTSYGPTWVGYEPWAWAPYHYGQWVNTAAYGWVWEPGYEWSPGRVVWATGPDYIGWSPVLSGNPDANFWLVVNRARFGYSNYSRYVLPPVTVRNLFDRRVVRVHSGPVQRVELQRILHRPVRVVQVDEKRVNVDNHSARLILPRGHESMALRQISRVSHRTLEEPKKIAKKEKVSVKKKPEKQMMMKSSSKGMKKKPEKVTTQRSSKLMTKKPERQVSMKSSQKVATNHRVEHAKIQAKTRNEVTAKSHASTKAVSYKSKGKVTATHKEISAPQHGSKPQLKASSQHHTASHKSKQHKQQQQHY